jgi:hypothetical protein
LIVVSGMSDLPVYQFIGRGIRDNSMIALLALPRLPPPYRGFRRLTAFHVPELLFARLFQFSFLLAKVGL